MEQIKHEELSEILERTNGWIENCDSKSSIILSGMGVAAGIFLATDYISKFIDIIQFMYENMNIWTVLYLIFGSLSICLLLYGAFLLIEVLFSRINTAEFEDRGVKTDSIIFFSSIAKNKTLSKYRGKLKKCSAEQLDNDIISQIYVCSLICDKKFSLYKKGLICSLAGFIIFMIIAIIGALVT